MDQVLFVLKFKFFPVLYQVSSGIEFAQVGLHLALETWRHNCTICQVPMVNFTYKCCLQTHKNSNN